MYTNTASLYHAIIWRWWYDVVWFERRVAKTLAALLLILFPQLQFGCLTTFLDLQYRYTMEQEKPLQHFNALYILECRAWKTSCIIQVGKRAKKRQLGIFFEDNVLSIRVIAKLMLTHLLRLLVTGAFQNGVFPS